MSPNHPEELLMKAVDGLLSDEERRELDRHLGDCPSCREELRDFDRIKETTDGMTARILADGRIEPPRAKGLTLRLRWAGWLALAGGCALLVGFAGWSLARDVEVPLAVKVALALLAVGIVVLFGYVLRARARAHGRDPYEEIDQ